jgi:hypothetical protein
MRRLLAATTVAFASLALAGAASAIDYGVTEDHGKVDPHSVYSQLQDLGMSTNVMKVAWNPLAPTALPPDLPNVVAAANVASAHGVAIILAVYQDRARGLADTPNGSQVLAEWVVSVLRACPACKKVIYLNEPNQTRFMQPVFNPDCSPASPSAYTQALAVGYDAIKAFDPSVRVYGLGLSPRGNDRCNAPSNISHSPTTFLVEMGKAYKAMGRSRPLMDALSFHPYPNVNTDPPMKGYPWPNIGVPNLDRLKQAFEDAFGGTAQPTFRDPSFKVALDEVGWQVDTEGRPGYHGRENVPPIDEAKQAEYYAELVRYFACDPSVESLNFFHLVDEADRDRFQTGLVRVDGSRRPSYDAVKQAIAETNGECQGRPRPLAPVVRTVIGGRADFRPLFPSASSRFSRVMSFTFTSAEHTRFSVGLFRVPARVTAADRAVIARALAGGRAAPRVTPVARRNGQLLANRSVRHVFQKGRLPTGTYVAAVRLSSGANPSRTVVQISRPFTMRAVVPQR